MYTTNEVSKLEKDYLAADCAAEPNKERAELLAGNEAVRKLCGDDDLHQELCLAQFHGKLSWKGQGSLINYLSGAAKKKFKQRYRADKKRNSRELRYASGEVQNSQPCDHATENEIRASWIGALTGRQSEILALLEGDGCRKMTAIAIAERLGITTTAVYRELHQMQRRLEKLISQSP